jgi:hypothetical protein
MQKAWHRGRLLGCLSCKELALDVEAHVIGSELATTWNSDCWQRGYFVGRNGVSKVYVSA